jgi:alpha-1,6-mannosyltransferase
MKICDVVQFYSPLSGGVKRYIQDKMRFLAHESRIEHVVIIPSDRSAVHGESRTRVYEVKSPRLIGSQSYRILLAREHILKIVDAEEPDLLEVGDPYQSAWIALQAGERRQIPVVGFYHSDYPRALGRTLHRFGGRLAKAVFSRGIESYLRGLYNRMSATVVTTKRSWHILNHMGVQRLVHIPLGTDTEVFYPRDSRQKVLHELGLAPDTMLLLYVGRLAREKNVRQLIAMMDHLSTERDPIHLLLVGDGELRHDVQAHVHDRSDVTWLPYSEDSGRLAELYSAADLFVHAGINETFGLVSLEAQACGTRVLAVRGGGMDETLSGEFPQIMAADVDAASLAEAVGRIRQLSETDEHRRQRRERIVNTFSWQRTYTHLTALYRHLDEGKPVESLVLPPGRTVESPA